MKKVDSIKSRVSSNPVSAPAKRRAISVLAYPRKNKQSKEDQPLEVQLISPAGKPLTLKTNTFISITEDARLITIKLPIIIHHLVI